MDIPRNIYKITPISNEKEWKYVQKFKQRAKEFIIIRDKYTPEIITSHINRLPNGTFTGSSNIPKEEEIKELCLAFRFFYLEQEYANFFRIRNIISSYSRNMPEVINYLERLKSGWNASMSELHSSDFIERAISGKEYIELWLNSRYFHDNFEKELKLQNINDFLSEDVSKFNLFMTIFTAGACVGLLYNTIENLSESNWEISIPRYY